jgi:hypothetical protein
MGEEKYAEKIERMNEKGYCVYSAFLNEIFR